MTANLLDQPHSKAAKPTESMPLVYTRAGVKRRKIPGMDLSAYEAPVIPGNRNVACRAAWHLVNALLFQGAILSLIPSAWKAAILRVFGAKVGRGFVCKPRVTIKYPWFIEFGDHVWLGEMVWIDNHCVVKVGSNVCVSQNTVILTGNHDWNDKGFDFFCGSVQIGNGSWIGAFNLLLPCTDIPPGTVIGASTWAPIMMHQPYRDLRQDPF